MPKKINPVVNMHAYAHRNILAVVSIVNLISLTEQIFHTQLIELFVTGAPGSKQSRHSLFSIPLLFPHLHMTSTDVTKEQMYLTTTYFLFIHLLQY